MLSADYAQRAAQQKRVGLHYAALETCDHASTVIYARKIASTGVE
jgi:hypothetical protein